MEHMRTIYGVDIVEAELAALSSYVVITNPIPWQMFESRFHQRPQRVLMPETLDQDELDAMMSEMPADVEFVGLGGGTAIDAAKYFAWLRNKTPVLIPTLTSSNAHFSDFISIRRNGSPFGFKQEGWPKRIIVDYALIQAADPRLNRAGFGDLLYMQTTLNDWRIAAEAGHRMPVDPGIAADVERMMETAIRHAGEIGSVTHEGLHLLMTLIEQSSMLVMRNLNKPITAGSEHLFSWNLEHRTGKSLIHGETVALGIVIASYLQQNDAGQLRRALDEAQVKYHPEQIGITWFEIEQTLKSVVSYNRSIRKFHTIFEEVDWSAALLNEIREYIYDWPSARWE